MRRTSEFLIQRATTGDRQRADELFKVDGAVLVDVEYVKHILGELARVTEWEELLVYSRELCLVELTGRAVFHEALVPTRRSEKQARICGGGRTIAAARVCRLEVV